MDNQQLEKIRHSTSHLLAYAVKELYGDDVKFAIGPVIEDGFYYDFDMNDKSFSTDDFKAIEKKMTELMKQKLTFEKSDTTINEALKKTEGQPYKQELINDLAAQGETNVSFYKVGAFEDLCRGPHVETTKELGNFKLLKIAGAYWRGSEKNKMLQRIYGTAFKTKDELQKYLIMLEEAKKRDHRKIGQDQNLFFIDDTIGKGLVMWQPNGTIIRDEIEKLAVETEKLAGYKRVVTPHLAKEDLYLTSGHLPYYKDSMYPAMIMDDGTYYLRAMNCPHHHMIYKHNMHSYRDLPLRIAEYGTVYRNELSGTLAGLLRVRGMAMNDAHIYCRKDQIKDEFKSVIDITLKYFKIFGLTDYSFRLSKWSEEHTDKYINEPANWEYSQKIIKEVLDEMKLEYEVAEDEAAFYGPKIDIQYKSIIGRKETMSTVQLDFLAKDRFKLSYTDKDGKDNPEVFVIHRAPLSTHERFVAFLIEHYAGVWPTWLSPVQVRIIPISEKFINYGQEVKNQIKNAKIRVDMDDSNESLGKRIRNAEKEKIPYILVIGEKEQNEKTVAVRKRTDGDQGSKKLEDFINEIKEEIGNKK